MKNPYNGSPISLDGTRTDSLAWRKSMENVHEFALARHKDARDKASHDHPITSGISITLVAATLFESQRSRKLAK